MGRSLSVIFIILALQFVLLVSLAFVKDVQAYDDPTLPDYLYRKGGVIYPRTGDSTQEIFHLRREVVEYLKPGMLIGVLPRGCASASHGDIGAIYICHYDLYLKPEEKYGKTVYRVIELD